MSNNLLELLKEYLSGDVVSNLAAHLGESPKDTESALHTALPAILGGLVDKAESPESISKLLSLLTEGNHDGGILSNLGALSRGGDETINLVSQGGTLLASLLGERASGMVDLVTNTSGINRNSSTSLLGFVTPVILGLIGKHMKIEHIDYASGLAGFLGSQKGFLQNVIPAGFTSTATTADTAISEFDKASSSGEIGDYIKDKAEAVGDTFSHIGDKIEDVAEETYSTAKHAAEDIGETASQFGSSVVHESKEFAHSAAEAFEEGAGEGNKFLPWLLIAAALALMWGLLKSCSTEETTTEATAPVTTAPAVTATPEPATPPPPEPIVAAPIEAPTPPTVPAPVEAPAPVVEPASDFYEKTLSTGYAIKAPKDGFASKLVGFIESDEAISKDLWFNMDGIQFDTNKATIKAESAAQIEHIVEVLKAFPKVKIKIGGYTDNTGKANANKKLSESRAIAVKKAIVGKDIKADRMDAEGYGSEHPVASNDTEEGRKQNRRIDVRVTEK